VPALPDTHPLARPGRRQPDGVLVPYVPAGAAAALASGARAAHNQHVIRLVVLIGLVGAVLLPAAASGSKATLDCECFSYYRINPDGTRQRKVSDSHGDLHDISADGTTMLFAIQVGTLWLSPVASNAPQHVAGTTSSWIDDARLSPDGNRAAYVARVFAGACANTRSIHVVRVDGSDDRMIVPGCAESVEWSPDGRRLSYVRVDGIEQGPSQLVVYDLDSATEHVLAKREGFIAGVAWAPMGDRLAYWVFKRTWGALHVVKADGTGDLAISRGAYARWSPDGRRLAYLWVPEGTRIPRVAVIARDGSLNHVVDARYGAGHVAWSPDGRKLVYDVAESNDAALFTANRDGTDKRRLVTGGWHEGFGPIRWRPGVIRYTGIVDWGD
jgi:hypothetical protein